MTKKLRLSTEKRHADDSATINYFDLVKKKLTISQICCKVFVGSNLFFCCILVSLRYTVGLVHYIDRSFCYIFESNTERMDDDNLWWIHGDFNRPCRWHEPWNSHCVFTVVRWRRCFRVSLNELPFRLIWIAAYISSKLFFSPCLPFRENATDTEIYDTIIRDSISYAIHFALATVLQLVSGVICVDCFNRTAVRQMTRMRIKYFESVMRQEIAWHDIEGGKSNFTVRISEWVSHAPFQSGVNNRLQRLLP